MRYYRSRAKLCTCTLLTFISIPERIRIPFDFFKLKHEYRDIQHRCHLALGAAPRVFERTFRTQVERLGAKLELAFMSLRNYLECS